MATDQDTADDNGQEQDPRSNHYTELREVYLALFKRHEQLKDEGKGKRAGEALCAVGKLEILLNEWNDRDDRDGHPEGY